MLRITVVDSSNQDVRLHVEGRLIGQGVEELRQSCEVHGLGAGGQLTLDLADVSFADVAGIELLRDLRSRSVTLLNPSPFLAIQIEGHAGGEFSTAK